MTPWLSRLHTFLGGAKSAPATDRRVAPRYKVELPVTIVMQGQSLRGRTCDLSQTGMGLYANGDLDVGQQLLLQYELGDGSPPKKVPATVRNRNGNRYGVEFGQ